MAALFSWSLLAILLLAIAWHRPARGWVFALSGLGVALFCLSPVGLLAKEIVIVIYVVVLLLFNIAPLRRALISNPLYRFYRNSMPEISQTEQEALDAGTTWFDAELFSGKPDWQQLLDFPVATLSAEEQAFIDGPVEEFCALLDDYRMDNRDKDLPPAAWDLIRQHGFFGMIIPKQYGGKGFSAYGHAAVIMKIATRSISAALTVMIPNSVGPGKLLLKYGTEAQKNHYLPRLAAAEEIPCFALTAPEAGSDAGALPDTGVVCMGEHEGRQVLGIRLNFDKRYITLGPIATVLGVAFKLRDPDHLLSDKENLGITLALIPAKTPGVEQGRRHDPMHMSFMNGPLRGKDVFVPMDWLIGGQQQAGNGWRMLMESLTDGRAISLPALSTAAAKVSLRLSSAYAQVRRQFKVPIGSFEGIEESLARIVGHTYGMDAARLVTLAALDQGHKPSVISAIMKYNSTEKARQVINDAIEIHGGAAVCLGPANPLGQLNSFPAVGVTVEGHNILTRNLITFGQGAIRCHPYLLAELKAAQDSDIERGKRAFDQAVIRHIGFSISNAVRSLLLGVSGAGFVRSSAPNAEARRAIRQLTRVSAAFAFVTDVLLLTFRGTIKRKERLSGRMADIISQLYLASTVLKHFRNREYPASDETLLRWNVEWALYKSQQSFDILLKNLPNRLVAAVLRILVFPLGMRYQPPSDLLDQSLARMVQLPGDVRDDLTSGMYYPSGDLDRLKILDDAFIALHDSSALEAHLGRAVRSRAVSGLTWKDQLDDALAKSIVTKEEHKKLVQADRMRRLAIQVDDFDDLT